MNRLQVGDECYVRNGEGKIFKARVDKVKDPLIVFIHSWGYTQGVAKKGWHLIGNKYSWRLVYPLPCIKELA